MCKLFGYIVVSMCIVFGVGCRVVRDVNVSETLQLPMTAQLYLSANLWYTNPDNIDARNLHTGDFIPVGTAVSIVESTNIKLVFRTLHSSQLFTVNYDESWMVLPVEEFMKRYFTSTPAQQQFDAVNAQFLDAIKGGRLEKGMTRNEVLMAWGYPVTARTRNLENTTWIYLYEPFKSKRVIFDKNGKVSDFIDLN